MAIIETCSSCKFTHDISGNSIYESDYNQWLLTKMYFEDDKLLLCPKCPKDIRTRFFKTKLSEIERELNKAYQIIKLCRQSIQVV